MADFAAVLRKTLDGLGETTPEVRAKVYAKARNTIEKKLASIDPKPAKAVVDRQMKALEDAISEVESDFTVAEEPLDDLDRLLEEESEEEDSIPDSRKTDPERDLPEPGAEDADAVFASLHGARAARERSWPRRALWTGAVLVLLGAAGYGAWARSDLVKAYTGIDLRALTGLSGPVEEQPMPAADEKPAEPENAEPVQSGDDIQPGEPEPEKVEKFTQRLTPEGAEVDPGPAAGEPTVGEGSSVAIGQENVEPAAGTAEQGQPATQPDASPVVAVGQKAFLYEEGTSTDQATAEEGGIVWSVIQESPGGDKAEEPAIHGVLTVPAKDITLSLTIRRNGDQTLPASHIIEVVFEAPEGFGGGGIQEMSRIALKESEQAAGSPLLGVPAKISAGFFLVALTDAKAAIDTNIALLRRQDWIDIPVVYVSGRRALFTMEKGVPGDRVFDEVLRAWQAAENG